MRTTPSTTNGNNNSDDDLARSEQLAADMQLAFDLQAEQDVEAFRTSYGNDGPDGRSRNEPVVVQGGHSSSRSPAPGTVIVPGIPVTQQQQQQQQQQQERRSRFSYPDGQRALNGILQGLATPPASSLSASTMDDGSTADNSLLHVACEVSGRMVEMMVDTGAQTSVISSSLMQTLNLEHKLNRRWQGIASGVGTARILGRIENCPVQIGQVEFLLVFIVIDVTEPLLLLGIDQMRRFRCLVDLERNKLVFGGRDGVEVDFLPSDPRHARIRDVAAENCTIS